MTEPTERSKIALCCGGKVFYNNCADCWSIIAGNLVESLQSFRNSCNCPQHHCGNCVEAKKLIDEYNGVAE